MGKTETILKVEQILSDIKGNKKALEEMEAQYREEMEALKARYYSQIERIKQDIRRKELELKRLAIRHSNEIFNGRDMAEFETGRLILQIKQAVKRARGVLEKLEELGWTEAIIVEKKVNWEELEKWPDERLIAVGTERVTKHEIAYDLK